MDDVFVPGVFTRPQVVHNPMSVVLIAVHAYHVVPAPAVPLTSHLPLLVVASRFAPLKGTGVLDSELEL